jgi:hypothetical protein
VWRKSRFLDEILGALLGTANLYNNTKRKHFATGIDVEGIPYGSVGINNSLKIYLYCFAGIAS